MFSLSALQVGVEGHDFRLAVAGAGEDAAVLAGRIFVRQFLQVVGEDHHAHAAPGDSNANGAVEHMPHLAGHRHFLDIFGHVGKRTVEVDFLLVVGAAPQAV